MGSPSAVYSPFGAVPRPKPTTWQQGQEQSAQDIWNAQYPGLEADQAAAGAGRTARVGGTDMALDRMGAFTPAQTAAFNPNEQTAYDPSRYYTGAGVGRASAMLAGGGGAPSMTGSVGGGGGSALERFAPSEMKNFSAEDVSGFDPTQYGETFARGAMGEFTNTLKDQMKALVNKDAATGRIRTGWFDPDRGQLVTRVASDFENKIAQEAPNFSAQRLSALTGGANLRFQAAQGADTLGLERAKGIDTNATTRYGMDQSSALERMKLGANTALSEEEMALNAAGEQARLGLSRAQGIDTSKYTRAHDADTLALEGERTGLASALEAERMARGDYNAAADRTAGFVSANRDWAAQDRQTQDERDALAAYLAYIRQGYTGGGNAAGGQGVDPGQAANRKLAASMGVPYVG